LSPLKLIDSVPGDSRHYSYAIVWRSASPVYIGDELISDLACQSAAELSKRPVITQHRLTSSLVEFDSTIQILALCLIVSRPWTYKLTGCFPDGVLPAASASRIQSNGR